MQYSILGGPKLWRLYKCIKCIREYNIIPVAHVLLTAQVLSKKIIEVFFYFFRFQIK